MNNNNQVIEKLILQELFDSEPESNLEEKEKVCFLEYDDGYALSPKCKIKTDIKSGLYEVLNTRDGLYFIRKQVVIDDYINLNNSQEDLLVKDILAFNNKKDIFKDNGVVHKRGILLYGKPGCGKTSFIHSFLNKFVAADGVAFMLKNSNNFFELIEGLKQIQSIVPEKQIVVVIEEIDKYQDIVSDLQNFLDGQNSLQHVVTLATTNNINDISPSLLRPSRFDWIIEYGKLEDEAKRKYLKSKGLETSEINKWVKDSDNFTIAMLKELFISVILLDNDYTLALSKIKDSEKYAKTSTYKKIGFKN